MTHKQTRPWWVLDDACDEYVKALSRSDDEFAMIKTLKIIRQIIVNLGLVAISLYSISLGGDPTIIGFSALAVLGGYNGLEFSDYMALLQAYQEVQNDE